ncbi:MAG: hypothetical protein DRJ13_13875 [Bacteroidetes bacterium]|nr:MAG: hypothetical protein DRJ13_13875 [Bacteroidota bacterium]
MVFPAVPELPTHLNKCGFATFFNLKVNFKVLVTIAQVPLNLEFVSQQIDVHHVLQQTSLLIRQNSIRAYSKLGLDGL